MVNFRVRLMNDNCMFYTHKETHGLLQREASNKTHVGNDWPYILITTWSFFVYEGP